MVERKSGVILNVSSMNSFRSLTKIPAYSAAKASINGLTPRGKKIIDNTPMGKFGEPEDLLGGTLFLLSDVSNFITGIVLPIDGGFNIYSGV